MPSSLAEPSPACPCGSGRPLADCCGRWLGGEPAPTAEVLMRSRYTAYVLGDEAYLLASWHPATRPPAVPMAERPDWCGLAIRRVQGGGDRATSGTVEFVARYREGEGTGALHETSRFVREEGRWFYVDGVIREPAPDIGRNAPCPCGSGRKFKRCCGG